MTPFADLELAVNRAVVDVLANSEAVVNGALRVHGIFVRHQVVALGALSAPGPTFEFDERDWPEAQVGDQIDIGDESLSVIDLSPAGAGMRTATLARAA